MAGSGTPAAAQTPEAANAQFRQEVRVCHSARHREGIDRRLQEIGGEWDVEQALEADAAAITLTGVLPGSSGDRRWRLLPAAVTAFLLPRAMQGRCPPLPLLRRPGVQTVHATESERSVLKALRGAFSGWPEKAARMLGAARARDRRAPPPRRAGGAQITGRSSAGFCTGGFFE